MRMHGHAAHDDMKYVPAEQIEEWRRKDPIDRQIAARRGARRRRRGAARRGQGGDRRRRRGGAGDADARRRDGHRPRCSPTSRRCSRTATPPGAASRGAMMPTMTYLQAISDGMREEMRADERVFVMGEDIGVVRRRVQGHRRLHRRVRREPRDGHAARRVGDHRHARSAPPSRACGRSPRCSSPTSSPAASTSSSTSPARCTTGMGLSVNITVRLPSRRRLLRRPVPLPEPRGVVHARARAEGRRAVDGRGRQGPADQGRARPQPGRVHGAQAPLPPGQGRRAGGHLRDAVHARASRARAPTSP